MTLSDPKEAGSPQHPRRHSMFKGDASWSRSRRDVSHVCTLSLERLWVVFQNHSKSILHMLISHLRLISTEELKSRDSEEICLGPIPPDKDGVGDARGPRAFWPIRFQINAKCAWP